MPQIPNPTNFSDRQLIEHRLIYIGLIGMPEFFEKLLAGFCRICDTLHL
ncbi:hypothetical protein [Nostoc sp.]